MSTNNESIVFIPGLALTKAVFKSQCQALSAYSILIANTCEKPSLKGIAEQLLEEAPPQFSLVGHSMGGYVAMEIMRLAPERVKRLALLSTHAHTNTPEQLARRKKEIQLAQRGRFVKLNIAKYSSLVAPQNISNVKIRKAALEMAEEIGPDVFIAQQNALIRRPDHRGILRDIRCPTLIIVGIQDQVAPVSLANEMHSAIAGSKLELFENCGHLSPLECPEEVNGALIQWMQAPIVV
ncbi:alpha/beta fold hydrolase [Flexibacterium corallicola]|uniref:alpha/beta fold hydrolase n=1 Tax=Flexibacterium corallicola TaxID=3037259 RepID=UPI00286F7DD0|nr:alpha/beta hydrolase [Pseudovibrio sp. M1P-2-3]